MTDTPTLPHQTDRLFLTDGGTETWLMYKRGYHLPHFSAFHLLNDADAEAVLLGYYRDFAAIAARAGTGFIFDSLTYRASRDWGDLLGYDAPGLFDMNRRCFNLYRRAASEAGLPDTDCVLSGCIGPKGDAYRQNEGLTAEGAEAYHAEQVETFCRLGAHLATALTLSTTAEAIGIARACHRAGLPCVIAFTLEKDRRLRSGETLADAINKVDHETGGAPSYYMINCAHPVDFGPALEPAPWAQRVLGIRANASTLDHGTLCQLGHLEEGDPDELAGQMADLRQFYPHMNVFGGCCGTDMRHVAKIAAALGAGAGAAPEPA